jgi:hypothetical protein
MADRVVDATLRDDLHSAAFALSFPGVVTALGPGRSTFAASVTVTQPPAPAPAPAGSPAAAATSAPGRRRAAQSTIWPLFDHCLATVWPLFDH